MSEINIIGFGIMIGGLISMLFLIILGINPISIFPVIILGGFLYEYKNDKSKQR